MKLEEFNLHYKEMKYELRRFYRLHRRDTAAA